LMECLQERLWILACLGWFYILYIITGYLEVIRFLV